MGKQELEDPETTKVTDSSVDIVDRLFSGQQSQVVISHDGVSQYRLNPPSGGQSACGLAALNCARLAFSKEFEGLLGEELISWLASRPGAEEITAICDLWSNSAHLDMEDILNTRFFSNCISLVEVFPERCGLAGFRALLQNMQRAIPSVSAVMITKPPEIVACMKIPTSRGDVFLVFDSHIRSNHPKGAGFIFHSSLETAARYLSRMFWVDHTSTANDSAFGWQMDLMSQFCGHILTPKHPNVNGPQSVLEDSMRILALTSENTSLRAQLREADQQNVFLTAELHRDKQRSYELQRYSDTREESSHSVGWFTAKKQRSSVWQDEDVKLAQRLQQDEWGQGSNQQRNAAGKGREARGKQTSAENKKPHVKLFDETCALCSNQYAADDAAQIPRCLHSFHKECLKGHVVETLQHNSFPIPCPACAATSEATESDVNDIILKHIGIEEEELQKFKNLKDASVPSVCPSGLGLVVRKSPFLTDKDIMRRRFYRVPSKAALVHGANNAVRGAICVDVVSDRKVWSFISEF
ncbi:hypothetical protein H0H87_001201 [Tephrocybe sp. NHM501043]|nr:hypothetical protein H0H87_001201 [Tephrocybe sp. NHM501043]